MCDLFSPSIFTWALGVRFRSPGLQERHFYLWVISPTFSFWRTFLLGIEFWIDSFFLFGILKKWFHYPWTSLLHFVSLFSLESCLIKSLSSFTSPASSGSYWWESTFDWYDGQELMTDNTSSKKKSLRFTFLPSLPPSCPFFFPWCWKLNLRSHIH